MFLHFEFAGYVRIPFLGLCPYSAKKYISRSVTYSKMSTKTVSQQLRTKSDPTGLTVLEILNQFPVNGPVKCAGDVITAASMLLPVYEALGPGVKARTLSLRQLREWLEASGADRKTALQVVAITEHITGLQVQHVLEQAGAKSTDTTPLLKKVGPKFLLCPVIETIATYRLNAA